MCIPSKNPGYGPDTIQVQLADGRDYFLENCAALYMRNQLHRPLQRLLRMRALLYNSIKFETSGPFICTLAEKHHFKYS